MSRFTPFGTDGSAGISSRLRAYTGGLALVCACITMIGSPNALHTIGGVRAASSIPAHAPRGHVSCKAGASIPASAFPSGSDGAPHEVVTRDRNGDISGGNTIDYPQMRISYSTVWYAKPAFTRLYMNLDLKTVASAEVPAKKIQTIRGIGDAASLWIASPPYSLGMFAYDTHLMVRQGHRYANISVSAAQGGEAALALRLGRAFVATGCPAPA